MELRHLRYFVAVAEEQNVTRASQRLHVSQPALSRQIHDLEEEVGVPLFERTAKSIALTPAGRLFLKEAKAVLRRVEAAVESVRKAGRKSKDAFHGGYSPSPATELLPSIIRQFEKAMPGVRVVLHDMSSSEMIAGLQSGRLQAAVIVGHAAARAQGLVFHLLRTYPIGVALPRNHPLAKKKAVSLGDIVQESLVGYNRHEYRDYAQWVRGIFGKAGRKLRFVEECDGALSLISAVESGRGLAVSARSVLSVAGSRIAFVPIVPAPKPMEVGVCCVRSKVAQPSIHQFIATAQAVAKR